MFTPDQVKQLAAKAHTDIQAVIQVLQAADSAIDLIVPGLESMARGGLLSEAHGAIQMLSNTGPLLSDATKIWNGIKLVA